MAFCAIWVSKKYADVVVKLRCEGGLADAENQKEISVHRLVLGEASTYWERRFCDDSFADGLRRGIDTPPSVVEHCKDEDDIQVALLVIQAAYVGLTNIEADVLTVAKMAVKAEYWNMVDISKQCLEQLCHQGQANNISSHDFLQAVAILPDTALTHGPGLDLTRQVQQHLMATLGNAIQIVRCQDLTNQFRELPFNVIKCWAAMDSLKSDTENTVVILLTLWCKYHMPHLWQRSEESSSSVEHTCMQLSKLVRLRYCSLGLHARMQELPWYRWDNAQDFHVVYSTRVVFERAGLEPPKEHAELLHWNQPRSNDGDVGIAIDTSLWRIVKGCQLIEYTEVPDSDDVYMAGFLLSPQIRKAPGNSNMFELSFSIKLCDQLLELGSAQAFGLFSVDVQVVTRSMYNTSTGVYKGTICYVNDTVSGCVTFQEDRSNTTLNGISITLACV